MLARLKRLLDDFRAWRATNLQAHANSKPSACCSAPPPGAGDAGLSRAP
jgi:hypothetical protein